MVCYLISCCIFSYSSILVWAHFSDQSVAVISYLRFALLLRMSRLRGKLFLSRNYTKTILICFSYFSQDFTFAFIYNFVKKQVSKFDATVQLYLSESLQGFIKFCSTSDKTIDLIFDLISSMVSNKYFVNSFLSYCLLLTYSLYS